MLKVVPLRYGTVFKKAFSDHEVFSAFASDVLGQTIRVETVQQEYRYPEAVGAVDIEYDLFGEDVEHRVIVELQHVREPDFFDRFLHYHAVGIIEQATSHAVYRPARTVFTIVVLTTEPRDATVRFSVAVSDPCPVTEQGKRLGVYRHRLVFLNPKVINAETPPAARRWMELIADSLDGEVEEARYADPLMQRILGRIRDRTLTPAELALVKDEAAWDEVQRDARLDGRLEGMLEGALREARAMLFALAQASGLALDAEAKARIEGCQDVDVLRRWTLRVPRATWAGDVFD